MISETGIAIILSVLVFIITLGGLLWLLEHRIRLLDSRVSALWSYAMDRALTEALSKGLAVRNSPLKVTDEVRGWYVSMLTDLKSFYLKSGRHMTEQQLFIEISIRFGRRILNEICIPHGLVAGSCIVLAMELAREVQLPQGGQECTL